MIYRISEVLRKQVEIRDESAYFHDDSAANILYENFMKNGANLSAFVAAFLLVGHGLLFGQDLSDKEKINRDLKAADQVLNVIYQRIIADLKAQIKNPETPEGAGLGTKGAHEELIKALTKAQRAWIAYKQADANLMHLHTVANGGHGGISFARIRELEITEERVQFFKSQFGQGTAE